MDQVFERFAKEIKFAITDGFKYTKLVKAQLDAKQSVFELGFQSLATIPFAEMSSFLKAINQNFAYKTKLSFVVSSIIYEPQNVRAYLSWVLGDYLKDRQLALQTDEEHLVLDTATAHFSVPAASLANRLNKLSSEIIRVMQKFGFESFTFTTKVVANKTLIDDAKARIRANGKALLDTKMEAPVENAPRVSRGYTKVAIDELREAQEPRVAIEGEVFKVDHRNTKTGLVISEISMTNFRDAVTVKLFGREADEIAANNVYQKGDYLYVNGDYQLDSYTKEPVVLGRKVIRGLVEKKVRTDTATSRRVEFGVRSRMSTMDGVTSAEEYVERIKKWDHQALAIVDLDSVQSFPDFYVAARKAKIKGIYGATFNTTEKAHKAIYQPINRRNLANDTYIVFDLETTGLSPVYHEMIEFGAVKIVNNQIVDSLNFFIKPKVAVPTEITRLTGINNEMLEGAIDESTALERIKAYIQDFTLIAHNANFDMGFLNQKLNEQNQPALTNAYIDTLIVGRITHPHAARFRLENLASRYGIEYDSVVAHRADYDADVLAKIWMKMVSDLQVLKVSTQTDLSSYFSESVLAKAFKYEVTLLAKNQAGLKELFQAISAAHTKTYSNMPTLLWETIQARKNLLLGSGALRSRLVDRMLFGTREQVKAEIANYDYIEVQPPRNFVHFQARGFTEAQIKDALNFVIQEAIKQQKIVIATSDARYLDESQKVYHEVYVNAKGLGGSRHYLYSQSSQQAIPLQNLLTTNEMLDAFAFLEDSTLSENIVINNTQLLASQIDNVMVIKPGLHAPQMADVDSKLEEVVYKNAHAKYGDKLPKVITDRIEKELVPIKKYGFAVIYWIAHLLVSKSLKEGYLVGSRGSVGSSLVATLANITEVNPLAPHYICPQCKNVKFTSAHLNSGYDLEDAECPDCHVALNKEGQNIPFETFLGFNADKTPDIDLNFSGEYQPTVHAEVRKLFGHSHTFRAGTIATVADRTAYGYVLSWAEDKQRQLSKAFVEFLATGVAGTKRTTGQHPGGIIVVPKHFDVEDFTPINYPANDVKSEWQTTHFDFVALHDNLLKLDLLGHDDPTAIRMLERLTNVDAKRDIPFSDAKVVSLFSSTEALKLKPEDINGEVVGVMGIPEFGTKLVRLMLRKARVNSFGDLIAVSGLSHGTGVWSTNAEALVAKENKTLNDVISCRDDIMIDLIAKKITPIVAFEIMEQVRKGRSITTEQEALLKKHGVEDWYIDSLKKIKYMFPKAHATAYVMMAWRVAWFKVYYPLAFYAVYLTTRADVFDLDTVLSGKLGVLKRLQHLEQNRNKVGDQKLSPKEQELIFILEIVNEAYARNVHFANIDLQKSAAREWVMDEATNTLYPPFISLDGLGNTIAESIISARQEKHFVSQDDFRKRTSINATQFEKLLSLGVFKHLETSNQIALSLF